MVPFPAQAGVTALPERGNADRIGEGLCRPRRARRLGAHRPGGASVLLMPDGLPGGLPCGRDSPAPSSTLRLGPETVVAGQCRKRYPCRRRWVRPQRAGGDLISQSVPLKGGKDVGQTNQAKPDVVVAVVRVVPVPVRGARVLPIVVPRAAAHHPSVPGSPTGRGRQSHCVTKIPKISKNARRALRALCAAHAAISDQRFQKMGDKQTKRKPRPPPRPSGEPWPRQAARAYARLSFQEPPRTTRSTPDSGPRGLSRGLRA